MAVTVRLHGRGPRVAGRVDLRAARTVVVEDVGRLAVGRGCDDNAVTVHEADEPELIAAPHRRKAGQLRLGSTPVVCHIDDVRGQPVAAAPVAMVVGAGAQVAELAERPVGLEVGERVGAPGLPAGPVELVEVGHPGPVADQAVPARVRPKVGLAVDPLVGILVDIVVREVAGEIEAPARRNHLGGDVLPFVPRRALHPVGRLLPDRGDPGARLTAEQRSGVDPHREPLAVVLAERGRRGVGPLRRRIVRPVVEGAAQRLDRAGGYVGRPLRHLDASEVHRVDEPVRLGAAEVVGGAVRKAVDGGADLRLADGHLEAAHDGIVRPVVEPVRVSLLDGYAGEVVHHRGDAGDVRLLPDHRHGYDVARESPGFVGDDAERIEQQWDLQNERDGFGGARPDRDPTLDGIETRQGRRYDIIAWGQAGEPVGAGDVRHAFLAHAGTGRRHQDARQREAVLVDDRALDLSGCLGRRGHRQRQQRGEDGEPARGECARYCGLHAHSSLP